MEEIVKLKRNEKAMSILVGFPPRILDALNRYAEISGNRNQIVVNAVKDFLKLHDQV